MRSEELGERHLVADVANRRLGEVLEIAILVLGHQRNEAHVDFSFQRELSQLVE